MTRSALFTAAHRITRNTVIAGDDYRVTFGLTVKALLAGWRPARKAGPLAFTEIEAVKKVAMASNITNSVNVWEKGGNRRLYINHGLVGQAARREATGYVDLTNGRVTWLPCATMNRATDAARTRLAARIAETLADLALAA